MLSNNRACRGLTACLNSALILQCMLGRAFLACYVWKLGRLCAKLLGDSMVSLLCSLIRNWSPEVDLGWAAVNSCMIAQLCLCFCNLLSRKRQCRQNLCHSILFSHAAVWTFLYARCRCVPGLLTREFGLISAQGVLLLSRTWLTDYISRIEARAGRYLIAQVCLAALHLGMV